MNVKIEKGALSGKIEAEISKSYLHRLLICAALSDTPCEISGRNDGVDVLATVGMLSALGAKIDLLDNGYWVAPIQTVTRGAILNARECGSSLRFILPVAAALDSKATLTGEGRLAARPIESLARALNGGGAKLSGERLPISIGGRLECGDYSIVGNVSSQYISGLLLALPLLDGTSRIVVEGATASQGYVDITLDVLNRFGACIDKTDIGYVVKGRGRYYSPQKIAAEGDWSNASFWMIAAALNGEISVTGLNLQSKQGDRRVLEILQRMGAEIKIDGDVTAVKKSRLKGIDFDSDDIPDLVPILAVAAACADGKTEISGVARLRDKESDRLQATLKMLTDFGAVCRLESDRLLIVGGNLHGAKIDGFNDHRMVMSAAVAASVVGGTTISGTEAVNKSYPTFFEDFARLGGNVK